MEAQTYPAFIVWLSPTDLSKASMELPSTFVRKWGDHVPEQVTLNIPNGYLYYVRFHKAGKKLKNMSLFYNDFQTQDGFNALCYYRGAGIFTIFILDHSGMEIDYPSKKKLLLAPVLWKDNINGIGEKFIVRTGQRNKISAEIGIPPAFVDQYRHMLKQKNFLTLKNGKKFMFRFLAGETKFVELQAVLRPKYYKAGDTLLFQLSGKTEFSVTIFSKNGVELPLHPPSSITDNVFTVEETNDMRTTFEAVLNRSNLHMNSHGVYVPSWVTLENHSWTSVKHAYLKMDTRKWKVGMVLTNGKPRFSSGWDKFVKENKLILNDKLRFEMIEEDRVLRFVVHLL